VYDPAVRWEDPPIPRVSYAQSMEDILLDRLFDGKVGRYMDVGANHPVLDSNTHFFHLRGWRGVNVEPIPRNHALFVEQRPDDLNLAVAVSDTSGTMTFYEVIGGGLTGLSTLSADIAHVHAKRLEVVEYEVPVRSIADLIREHSLEPPDFLSIDVECHEDRVLRGIPLETWRPRVIVVESIQPISLREDHLGWESILLGHGYLFGTTNGVNRFYLRRDMEDRLPRLEYPVSVLDRYERCEIAELREEIEELRRELALAAMHRNHFEIESKALRAELEQIREAQRTSRPAVA
jgi:FkbM family methyltransferase